MKISVNISDDICIDAGSEYISMYIVGKGLVLREKSSIAYNIHTNEVVAFGDEAAIGEERSPKTVKIYHPIQGGVICDSDMACELISRLFAKIRGKKLVKPRVMLSVPASITDVEGKAFINAVVRAGARQVIIVPSSVTAALGAGCDVTLARGLMVLDIGAEKIDIAAISLSNVVVSNSLKIGGNNFTDDLKMYLKHRYNLETGTQTCENLKIALGIKPLIPPKTETVCGSDITTHLPRKISVSSSEILNVYDERINKISRLIKDTLDSVPPEISGDILSDGILLVGGSANLSGLPEKLTSASGIKIFPAENPQLCNIKGTGLAMEHLSELPNIAQSYYNI